MQVEGFDEDTSTVVARDEFTETFDNADGTSSVKVSTDPLNTKTDAGTWVPVDTTVTADKSGASAGQVVKHGLRPRFAKRADAASVLSVSRGGVQFGMSLVGAASSAAVRSGSSVTYPAVFPGVDLRFDVTAGSVQDNLVLASPAAASVGSWSWRLTGSGFSVVPEEHGSGFQVLDASGVVQVVIPPAVMSDSSGVEGVRESALTNAAMTVSQDASGWVLTVTPDQAWLNDPARV